MVFNVQPFWNVDLTSHPWRSNCQASWRRFPSIPRRIGVITLIFVNVPKQKVVEVLKWKRCFGKNMSNGTWSIWRCSLPCSSPFCRSGISMVAVTSANSHGAQRTPSSAGMIDMSKELPTCFQVPALTLSFWMCWLTQRAEMEVKPWNRCQLTIDQFPWIDRNPAGWTSCSFPRSKLFSAKRLVDEKGKLLVFTFVCTLHGLYH